MYLLKQNIYTQKCGGELLLYKMDQTQWILEAIYKLYSYRSFYDCIQTRQESIEYAIIGINQPYRNILYHFYPHIKVIIDKEEVIRFFEKVVGTNRLLYEEVAVSAEKNDAGEIYLGDIRYFIYDFYNHQSREEAKTFYELWQMMVPVNDKAMGRFIRTMEYFLEEVLNYFEPSIKGNNLFI